DRQARAAFGRALEWDFIPGTDDAPGGPTVISARARIELGKLAAARSELDTALSEFLKVAVLFAHDEEVAEALFRAGEVLEAQGNAAQARERFAEAASRYPETPFGDRARRRLTN
ncbi:MAG: tetratricopeptide repeat protein, partial [Planctomycetota bacterium]